jgi:hypothetical protein
MDSTNTLVSAKTDSSAYTAKATVPLVVLVTTVTALARALSMVFVMLWMVLVRVT